MHTRAQLGCAQLISEVGQDLYCLMVLRYDPALPFGYSILDEVVEFSFVQGPNDLLQCVGQDCYVEHEVPRNLEDRLLVRQIASDREGTREVLHEVIDP